MSGSMNSGAFGNQLALMDPAVAAAMRRQAYAQQLLGQASDVSPLRSPWQAAARAVSGVLGGYEMNQGQQQMEDYAAQSRQAMSDLYGNMPLPSPSAGTVAAPAPAPTSITAPRAPGPGSTQALAPPALLPTYQTASSSSGIPAGVLMAKDATESNFNPTAVSSTGAVGVGQVLPSTASSPGYGMDPIPAGDLTDPSKNIPWSANYLAARGKSMFGDAWDPTNRTQLRTALMAYRGPTPDAGAYADKILDNAGLTARAPTAAPSAASAPAPSGSPDATAAAYGMQMARSYQAQAVEAAKSPIAAVRAMAPQFRQQALGALQYGRFQVSGTNPQGQMLVTDRFGEHPPTAVGAELKLYSDAQGNLITPAGSVVSPGLEPQLRTDAAAIRNGTATPEVIARYNGNFQKAFATEWKQDPTTGAFRPFPSANVPADLPVPPQGGFSGNYGAQVPPVPGQGQGGATMPQPNVDLARQSGVPVMPGFAARYGNLTPAEAGKALLADRTAATAGLKDSDTQAEAAYQQIQQLQRFKQLNQEVPTGPDFLARADRWSATGFGNSDKLQELRNLSNSLVPGMRTGTGISRVTNKDMGIFQSMAPGENNSAATNNQIVDAAIAKQQHGLDYNRFQHAYVEANGSMAGGEAAWDRYMQANPILTTDKTGNFQVNPNRQQFSEYFRQNTDPGTGQLAATPAASAAAAGGQQANPLANLNGKIVVQNGQRMIVRGGVAVPLGPS